MNPVVGTGNGSEDVSKLHYPSSFWYSSGSMMKVYKKLSYLSILMFTLIVIRSVTDWNILTQAVQHHEPSLRIFRSLFEIALLLLCTSASVSIYTRYLSYHMTHDLLFQNISDRSSNDGTVPSSDHHHLVADDDEALSTPNADCIEQNEVDMNQRVYTSESRSNVDQDDEVTLLASNTKSMVFHSTTTLYSKGSVPSPISILCMALDMLIWIVMTFVLYLLSAIHAITAQQQTFNSTTNDNVIYSNMARIAAPTFPLLLFLFCFLRIIQFRKVFSQLYTVISFTLHAPLYDITFRDGMIGDILTSMVRPMQDVAFTVCYILFGLRGWWSDHYFESTEITTLTAAAVNSLSNEWSNSTGPSDLSHSFLHAADARVPAMERSWILHTAILPACMISPLWWRFLQTMRQCYDTKQRWPYLGNSFKYFFAAQVAMLGVYHPGFQHSPSWILSFVVATLYQIYWDVFMDWGLLVPGENARTWKLRSQRLYPYKGFYWALVIINTLLRFCWTLSFVPFHYLSAAGVLTSNFSSEAWSNILVPTIASAEIIRRTLWGLLRVEWEAIKVGNDMSGKDDSLCVDGSDEFEMTPMKVHGTTDSWNSSDAGSRSLRRYGFPTLFSSDMSAMNELQIFGELCLYTTTFAALGLIIAAHRGTM